MAMSYEDACNVVMLDKEQQEKAGGDQKKLKRLYKKNNLSSEVRAQAAEIVALAEAINAEKDTVVVDKVYDSLIVAVEKDNLLSHLDDLSLEQLVQLETQAADLPMNNPLREKILKQVKEAAQKAIETARGLNSIDGKNIAPAEYFVATGAVSNAEDISFVEEKAKEYDESHGLEGKSAQEIDSLISNIKDCSESVDEDTQKEINSYFKNVTYTESDGTEITDAKTIKSYNDRVVDAAVLDTYLALLANPEYVKADKNKGRSIFNETLKENIHDKLIRLNIASTYHLSEKEVLETDVNALTKKVAEKENKAGNAGFKKRINVDTLIAGFNDSLTNAESFVKRARAKTKNINVAQGLKDFATKSENIAKTLWKNRQVIAKNIVNNAKDNRWKTIGNFVALGTIVVGAAAGGLWTVGGALAYVGWTQVSTRWMPVVAKRNKLKRELKEKGQPIPSKDVLWNLAKKEVEKDPLHAKKCEKIREWGIWGAVAMVGAYAAVGPLAAPAMKVLAKVPAAFGSLSTHIVEYRENKKYAEDHKDDAKAQENAKSARNQMCIAAIAPSLLVYYNMDDLAESAGSIKELFAEGGVFGKTLQDPEGAEEAAKAAVESADASKEAVSGESATEAEAEAAKEATEEAFTPKYANVHSDSMIMSRLKSWTTDANVERLVGNVQEMHLEQYEPSLKGLTPLQQLYLMYRQLGYTPGKATRERLVRGLMEGDCLEGASVEELALLAKKGDDTFAITSDMGLGVRKDGLPETKCVKLLVINDYCEGDTKIVDAGCGCEKEDIIDEVQEGAEEEAEEEAKKEDIDELHSNNNLLNVGPAKVPEINSDSVKLPDPAPASVPEKTYSDVVIFIDNDDNDLGGSVYKQQDEYNKLYKASKTR